MSIANMTNCMSVEEVKVEEFSSELG